MADGTEESGEHPAHEEALARAVDAIYAAPAADFVATRKEWVTRLRSEGMRDVAKQVGALRKPSVAAAAVNSLVRADDPVVARLADLGARMRHAQSALDVAALGAMRGERDELLAAWVAAAREHGGALTAAVEAEVRDTAVAALADAAAEEVVTSGSLTRALSYSGFGEVDVADAVARTSTGVMLTRIEGGRADEAVEEEGEEEGGEVDEDEGHETVEDEGEDDESPEDDADQGPADDDVAALEMDLGEAEKAVAAARAARKKAVEQDTAAQKAAAAAQRATTAAAALVEEAERALATAKEALALAQEEADRADAVRTEAAEALKAADEDLARSRDARDAARAALEEAEDRS